MRWSWKLGRVAGIDLFFHPSALLILAMAGGPEDVASVALAVALLGSIVLHELGHALMARRYGIETEDITLYLFGGVARLARMPRSPGPELLVALAGPAVNLVIVAAALPVALLAAPLAPRLAGFGSGVVSINIGLALFNLLPVFPMDGGRVLRALLTTPLGRLRATAVAATTGQALAIGSGLFFLAAGQWQAAIVAGIVYGFAGAELARVRAEAPGGGGPSGAPAGFRWADRGDGTWWLVPSHPGGGVGRSWA